MRWLRPMLQSPRQYLACALFWLLMAYPMLKWWKASVLFVAIMSLYTIVKSELVGATATELSDKDRQAIAKQAGMYAAVYVLRVLNARGVLDSPGDR